MTVTECTIGDRKLSTEEALSELRKGAADKRSGVSGALDQLRALAGLCNASEFDMATMDRAVEDRGIFGDATDQAILRFSEKMGSVQDMRQSWQKTYELAFNSKNKFMIRTFSMFRREHLPATLTEEEGRSFGDGDT